MKKALTVLLLTSSTLSLGNVDYKQCNNMVFGMFGPSFDKNGNLQVTENQKVLSKDPQGNFETYVIETDAGLWGGNGGPVVSTVVVEKDDQGRVVSYQNGKNEFTKNDIKEMKEMMLNLQVQQSAGLADAAFGNLSLGMGGGWGMPNYTDNKMTNTFEPSFPILDKNGKPEFVKLTDLNKTQRKYLNMSDSDFRELKKQFRGDKRSIKKIRNGLKRIQKKGSMIYPLGEKTHFTYKDGKCQTAGKSFRYYNEKENKIFEYSGLSKKFCKGITELNNKYEESLNKCDELQMEAQFALSKIQSDLLQVQGIGLGYGGYPTYGGAGYGSNSLQSLKYQVGYCRDFYNGNYEEDVVSNDPSSNPSQDVTKE